MGKFLRNFKNQGQRIDERVNRYAQQRSERPREAAGGKIREQKDQKISNNIYDKKGDTYDDFYDEGLDEFKDDKGSDNFDPYEANLQPAQKPESFHHFILDNKFRDLERSIRGYKDVYNKQQQKWEVKRKEVHCFTDEEAESIVRIAQVHLGTDIKLARMSLEAFGQMMDLIYDELERFFYRIAEYRYGRYGSYEIQGKMKDENMKILVELYNSIWANYSRAVGGMENAATHDSVRGQESLQNSGQDMDMNRRYG